MVQNSWIGQNKSYTVCHFLSSTTSPEDGLRGLFGDLPLLWARARYTRDLLLHIPVYRKLFFCGEAFQKNSFSAKQHSDAFAVPCCSASLCCWESLQVPGAGRSAVQQSVPGRCGRRSNFPKRGTAATVVEFLGQQVWKPIWSAGVFTRLENKPE